MTEGFIIEAADVLFEEDLQRNPFSVTLWLRYLEHKRQSPRSVRNVIYERALKELPGSFKLWYHYLRERRSQVRSKSPVDPAWEDVNNVFERALVFMHKMPRIWMDYCRFIVQQGFITRARHTFDRALQALPITQHKRIWPMYLDFVREYDVAESAVRVYRRYLKLAPEDVENYINYLLSVERLDEAARRLAFDVVNNENFVSKEGKTHHQLWVQLCELMSKHPDQVKSLKVDAIIRGGLRRFTDMLGKLWCALADYYIRLGNFDKARDIYEEAIVTVMTVRDFSQVFDAYAQFEESSIATLMEIDATGDDENLEVDMQLARLEHLMQRRPLLLNSVLLRQNPHNVHEWLKRVSLYDELPEDQIRTYTEAIATVEVSKAVGNVSQLWIDFAKFYEDHDQMKDAREVFEKAVKATFRKVDELADVWRSYAEMELRHDYHQQALAIVQRATTPTLTAERSNYHDDHLSLQDRVFRSLTLWKLYADLEESLGTFESTKAVYNRILDLRIATPEIIINYALFLEESNYFEEAFTVYERAVSIFKWPVVADIWNTYLTKFVSRYGGKKLERARDLFEQALSQCPKELSKNFFLMYAKLEEDFGLARHAMNVYERATQNVPASDRFELYQIYVKRTAETFGIVKTRPIFERAIESLPDREAKKICLQYAELERKLGEIDRARAIFAHGSQMADPRTDASYWKAWNDFEVKHGNEETFREMLRVKRSVIAAHSTQINVLSAQMVAAAGSGDAMSQLEREAGETTKKISGGPQFVRAETNKFDEMGQSNPEEIDVGDDEDEEDNSAEARAEREAPEIAYSQKAIPSAVYGGIAVPERRDDEDGEGDGGQQAGAAQGGGAKALFASKRR